MESPTPDEIRQDREQYELSRSAAAALVYKSVRSWEKYETGERVIDPAVWELWQIKVRRGDMTADTRYRVNWDGLFSAVEPVNRDTGPAYENAHPTFQAAKAELLDYFRQQRDRYAGAAKAANLVKESDVAPPSGISGENE